MHEMLRFRKCFSSVSFVDVAVVVVAVCECECDGASRCFVIQFTSIVVSMWCDAFGLL